MNIIFAEATTSIAFALVLSKRQCNELLRVERNLHDLSHGLHMGTLQSLDRRGLVSWKRDEAGNGCGFNGLTEAGKLMCGLLKEAGLTIENTNTAAILRRAA